MNKIKQQLMEEALNIAKVGKKGIVNIAKQLRKKVPELASQLIKVEILSYSVNLIGTIIGLMTVGLICYIAPNSIEWLILKRLLVAVGIIFGGLSILCNVQEILIILVGKDLFIIRSFATFIKEIKNKY